MSTANGSIPIVEGARASLSPAFDDADHAYIENGPAMRAVGLDCEKADGKTFIWVAGRVPCYVDRRRGVITIFDKEHHNPVYGPWFEWDDKLHGTFDMGQNFFKTLCGVYIDQFGQICLDLDPYEENAFQNGYDVNDDLYSLPCTGEDPNTRDAEINEMLLHPRGD